MLGYDGSKSCKHCSIDGSCIVKESPGDFLYNFFVCWCQEKGVVSIGGVLCLCLVYGLDVGVRLILWFSWMFMVETFDGICNIFEHGDVDDAVLVIPI